MATHSKARAWIGGLAMLISAPLVADGGEMSPALAWHEGEELPDVLGRKGMYGGVSGGHVLLAGGSNFLVPQRAGGRKTFHRDVFVRPLPLDAASPWRVAGFELPTASGEGAAVTTGHGIACLGGHDGVRPLAQAFLLSWDPARAGCVTLALPALPEAVANAAAALLDGWLYVAGGEGAGGARGDFWRLDLAAALRDPASVAWERLPGWPGVPRFGCILSVVTTAAGPRLLLAGGLAGPAKSQRDYLRDAMLFDPEARRWSEAATMPRGAVLGAAVALPGDDVLVLGGSDGHDFERMKELGERYRIPDDVLAYDGRRDAWSGAGTMPVGVVGASVVALGDSWLVAGGEFSPGMRTPRVFQLTRTRKDARP